MLDCGGFGVGCFFETRAFLGVLVVRILLFRLQDVARSPGPLSLNSCCRRIFGIQVVGLMLWKVDMYN